MDTRQIKAMIRVMATAPISIFCEAALFYSSYSSTCFTTIRLRHGGFGASAAGEFLIFFVHTSLVLMFSLERHSGASFSDKYRDFLIRRCFRIYPLSIATVLIAVLLAIPAAPIVGGHFASIPIDAEAVISNLLLVQDLTGSPSVIPTLWSLPYEMQMYLVLPILFFTANSKNGIHRLLGCLALAALVGALLPQAQWHGWKMPTFVPCFLAGVISYRLSLSQRPVLPGWMWPLFIAAITLLYMARPGIRAGWVCCLLLGLGIPFFAELRNARLLRICHLVAKYSYGIYLMHFICLWISFCLFAAEPEWFHLTLFFLLVALTSVVAYHAVERPFIKFGRWLTARRLSAPTPVLASAQPK